MTDPDPTQTPPLSEAEMDALMLKAGWRKTADGKHYAIEAVAPPPDAALPVDAETALLPGHSRPPLSLASSAALAEDGLDYLSRQAVPANPAACLDAILCARTHIAALTAQNAALVAERDALKEKVAGLEVALQSFVAWNSLTDAEKALFCGRRSTTHNDRKDGPWPDDHGNA